jgi:Acetyltransferase (GNAT) domain
VQVVEGRRYGIRDRLVFFPAETQIASLIDDLSILSVTRIRQTDVLLRHPAVMSSSVFRTACIDLQRDDESLLADMSKTSRNEIRGVERLDNRVDVRTQGDQVACDFLELYGSFVRAKGHTHPLSARRLSEYRPVCDLWVAYLEGEAVCGHLLLRDDDEGRVRFLYEANMRHKNRALAKMNSRLNRYLHWQSFRYYRDHGFTVFDWGGIGDGTGPIAQFKLSMGGEPHRDYSYVLAGSVGRSAYRVFTRYR